MSESQHDYYKMETQKGVQLDSPSGSPKSPNAKESFDLEAPSELTSVRLKLKESINPYERTLSINRDVYTSYHVMKAYGIWDGLDFASKCTYWFITIITAITQFGWN